MEVRHGSQEEGGEGSSGKTKHKVQTPVTNTHSDSGIMAIF